MAYYDVYGAFATNESTQNNNNNNNKTKTETTTPTKQQRQTQNKKWYKRKMTTTKIC